MLTLLPPPRRRRATFMLTPLVDVMFLLLIFFMLSSQTALYTLVRISAEAVAADGGAPAAPSSELLVGIGRGELRLNGRSVTTDALPGELERFRLMGVTRAALVANEGAEVQDVIAVVETFEAAAFGQVRLISGAVAP